MASKNSFRSIQNKETYEALREQGASKEKAARIANTSPQDQERDSRPYEQRTRKELYRKAQEIGIEGRSDMSKGELIEALRDH